MNIFRKLSLYIIVAMCMPLIANAQSAMVKKAAKSMFRLTTFDEKGAVLHTGYGVFVSEDGVCLANWDAFKDAYSANVIDVQGRKYDVDCMIGANDIYNVSKFKVIVPEDKKYAIAPISIASGKVSVGGEAWFVEYNVKNPTIKRYSPTTVESFGNDYPYYIFEQTAPEELTGSPFLNANGELMGLMQQAKKRTDLYCAAAQFAMAMTVDGLSINNSTLRQTKIRIALPDEYQQALVALMMMNKATGADNYIATCNEFIRKFPKASDGYTAKADFYADKGDYELATKTINEAISASEKKEEVHYAFSRTIFYKLTSSNDSTLTTWTLDKAIDEIDAALAISPEPTYSFHKGKILFAQKKYDDAYKQFIELTNTNMRGADCFYFAAQSLQASGAEKERVIEMLDSTVACFEKPYRPEAATYILARAKYLESVDMSRKAVADYNAYEEIFKGYLGAEFYYTREQAELKARLYQLALNDIEKAISIAPNERVFLAEKALLYVRVNKTDEAIEFCNECISHFNDFADAYAILGLAQIHKNKKAEGLANLKKSQEMGSELAEPFIEKYGK